MELFVHKREKFGKATRALRQSGLIPGELYGHGVKNVHVAVVRRDFEKVFRAVGENTVVRLKVEGAVHPVLIHDVQRDYLSGETAHIDFYEVRMDEKITAHVPLEFRGEAPAVKEKGGFLNKVLQEVNVEALPGDLPHRLVVDVSGLDDFHKSFYVRDLAAPAGVKILTDLETAIATVMPPVAEEKVEVAAPVDVSQIKVEGEEKKAERAAEKAAEGNEEK